MPLLKRAVAAPREDLRRALAVYADHRAVGPDFERGDPVVFAEAVRRPRYLASAFAQGLKPGAPAVVLAWTGDGWNAGNYTVAFVDGEGDIREAHVSRNEIEPETPDHAEA